MQWMDALLVVASCVLLIFGSKGSKACCFGFVGTAAVYYVDPDASGFQVLMTMSIVWCASAILVNPAGSTREDKLLSVCLGAISLLVGCCAVIDKTAGDLSGFARQLFVLYPYAMIASQSIALMIVLYGGLSSVCIHCDSVFGRLFSRRKTFYLLGEK